MRSPSSSRPETRLRRVALAAAAAVAVPAAIAISVGCQALVGIEGSSITHVADAGVDPSPTSADATVTDGDSLVPRDSTTLADAGSTSDASFDGSCDTTPGAGALDAVAEADAPDAAACTALERRCNGNTLQQCTSGAWTDETTCTIFCRNAQCETPPSCTGINQACGTSGDPRSCCSAHVVEGGAFVRDFDGITPSHDDDTYKATVSSFVLDDFEVTVERFSRFVAAYPATGADGGAPSGSMPTVGKGKNPNDPNDDGWEASFPMPQDRAELIAAVANGPACDAPTWSTMPSHLPIACAPYYVAYAFCIWDGGRLPSEAEWNYAASGGGGATDGQRVYPFSDPRTSLAITPADAVYGVTAPLSVGSTLPRGQGKWKQADLAGNLSEWVRDSYNFPYLTNPCMDCADHTPGSDVATRGGDYSLPATLVEAAARSQAPPTYGFSTIGFRCARSK